MENISPNVNCLSLREVHNASKGYRDGISHPREGPLMVLNGTDRYKQSTDLCCCPPEYYPIVKFDRCTCFVDPQNRWLIEGKCHPKSNEEMQCTCYEESSSVYSGSRDYPNYQNDDNDMVAEEGTQTDSVEENQENHSSEKPSPQIEQLQLDLIECALEYELKILEMKMKMHKKNGQEQFRDQNQRDASESDPRSRQSSPGPRQPELSVNTGQLEKMLSQRLDICQKEMGKLRSQRDTFAKELFVFKKNQRKADLQRKNIHLLMNRLRNMQRLLSKKEEEVVKYQLREKQTKARISNTNGKNLQNYEKDQLMQLIPSIQSWLQSLKKNIQGSAPPSNSYQQRSAYAAQLDCIKEIYSLRSQLNRVLQVRQLQR